MRIGQRIKCIGALLCALALLVLPGTAVYAEEYQDSNPNDYVTKQFDVKVEFDTAHVATITEEIKVDFRKRHHGITRNIPVAKDGTYEVTDIVVDGHPCKVEEESNNTVIRIGDGSKYVFGDQTYKLHYKIRYFKEDNDKADFLAQNLLPTEWETSIRQSKLTLVMPEEIDWQNLEIYAGPYGESDSTAWANYFKSEIDGNRLTMQGKNLPKGYGVTLRDTGLANGYWKDAKSIVEVHRFRFVLIFMVTVISAIIAVFLWIKYGRDEKIVETVEFYPPDDMTPAELGYALDEDLSDAEMMTSVFYLADKGYLTIEPDADQKHFTLYRNDMMGSSEPRSMCLFLNGMFKNRKKFSTKKPPKSFYEPLQDAKEQVKAEYEGHYGEVFSASSCVSRWACGLFALINMMVLMMAFEGMDGFYLAVIPGAFALAGMYLGWKGFDNLSTHSGKGIVRMIVGVLLYAIGVVAIAGLAMDYQVKSVIFTYVGAQVILYFFSIIMQKRTKKSTELMGRVIGFRRFIKEAEYERILQLSEEDPEYFYHILPYAAVLGLDTEWTKHFENIRIQQPSWYQGDMGTFLYSSAWCHDMVRSCTKSAVPPTPSSGSSGGFSGGSSGGGFSGGGGGGGGGGAW
jgi:uncharacterized membrane protein YgcG